MADAQLFLAELVAYDPGAGLAPIIDWSTVLDASWTLIGTPTRSAAAAYVAGYPLDLVGDDSAAAVEDGYRAIAFTGNGSKVLSCLVKRSSAYAAHLLQLYDNTAAAARLNVTVNFTAATPVVTASVGSVLAVVPVQDGWWLVMQATGVVAANSNIFFVVPANGAAADTASLYIGVVRAWDSATYVGPRLLTYATGRGLVTTPSEAPASTLFDPRVAQPADLTRDVFDNLATMGAARVGYGDLVLNNQDGALDALADYGFDGWPITLRQGADGAAYPGGFTTVFVGTMEQPLFDGDAITVKLRDRIAELQVPLQTNKYLGNNALPAGLEGVAGDLKDKPKPVCLGVVKNITPPCVNTSKLIYQLNDGAIASVNAVHDGGIALGVTPYGQAKVAHGKGHFAGRGAATDGAGHLVLGGGDFDLGYTGWILYGDGATWTKVTPALFNKHYIEALAFGAGVFVAVGSQRNGAAVAPAIATSADYGATWTTRTAPGSWTTADSFILECRWLAGIAKFCITTTTGKVATSGDGITWTDGGLAIGSSLWDVATDGTNILAVGNAGGVGVVYRSTNGGASFGLLTTYGISGGDFQTISYANRLWLIAGLDTYSAIWTSQDGVTWIQRLRNVAMGATNMFNALYSDGWWAIGNGVGVLISRDSVAWFADSIPANYAGAFTQVVFGSRWWAVGDHTFTTDYGVAASPAPVAYANTTDLLDDTLAPRPGSYGVCATAGYFRLGASPAGLITADVTQGAAAADRKPGAVFSALLQRANKSATDWSAADVTAADALGYVLGHFAGPEATPTIAEVLDLVAQSIGGWWGLDKTGIYRLKQLVAPSGTAALAVTADDLKAKPRRLNTGDPGRGLPVWRVTLRHTKNWTVQTDGVVAGVSDVDRAALALEWQTAKYETSSVKLKHRLSPEYEIDTLLTAAADALTEATRIQGLRGTRRDPYELVLELNSETVALDLASVIDFTYAPNGTTRYALSGPKKMLVLGVRPNAAKRELTLTVWG